MKKCRKCKKEKAKELFYVDKQKKDGLSAYCKNCKDKENNNWKNKNLGRIKNIKTNWLNKNKEYRQIVALRSHLKKKYGLTIEQYESMVLKQNGLCAICQKPDTSSRLSVDHDHKTNKIRGLLCRPCNTLLGLAKEDVKVFLESIKYLNNYK